MYLEFIYRPLMQILAPPLLLASLLALAGCESVPGIPLLSGADPATLPRHLRETPLEVAHFNAPETLAGLKADGEISRDDRLGWRQWHYRGPDSRLSVTVYGLPAGWEDLTDRRILSGHYGQLRQEKVNRVYNSREQTIEFVNERLFDLEGHVTASAAYRVMEANRSPLREVLLLTLEGDHFVRLEAASRRRSAQELLAVSKRALAEFRATQKEEVARSKEQVEKRTR